MRAAILTAVLLLNVAAGATASPPPRVLANPAPNSSAPVQADISADGTIAWLTTASALLPLADADAVDDVYEWRAGQPLRLVSPGITTAAGFAGASADGSVVYIRTTADLSPDDSGAKSDAYRAHPDGTYTLTTAGDPAFDSVVDTVSTDGAIVHFETPAGALGTDAGAPHLFVRDHGTLRLTSSGTADDAAQFIGASPDGTIVWFGTPEAIAGTGDGDLVDDLYVRIGTGPIQLRGGDSPDAVGGNEVSADGLAAVFSTTTYTGLDADPSLDVFIVRSDGTTTLASPDTPTADAVYSAQALGASRVWFTTADDAGGLDPVADGGAPDLFEFRPGLAPSLVHRSPGPGGGTFFVHGAVSADGDRLYFTTDEALLMTDVDAAPDVYEHRLSTGAVRAISSGIEPAGFAGATADGSRVFFVTGDPLDPVNDPGTGASLYERATDGTVRLVTPTTGTAAMVVYRIAPDLSRIWFSTTAALTPDDVDSQPDMYVLTAGAPTVSVENPAGANAVGATLTCAVTVESELATTATRQWLDDGVPIVGATGPSITVALNHAGHRIACQATAESAVGKTAASSLARTIRPWVADVRVTPALRRVGRRLRCRATIAGAVVRQYAWFRGTRRLAGATATTYRARRADRGKRISCRITARNVGGDTVVSSRSVRVR
jgi:hypothetical protein